MQSLKSIYSCFSRSYSSLIRWEQRLNVKVQAAGYPGWISKIPFVLILLMILGMTITSLLITVLIMLIITVVPWIISAAVASNEAYREEHGSIEGYRDGPEGYGDYVAGSRIDNDL